MPRLYKRPHTGFLWCQYNHRGETYRESTQETDPAKARAYLKHRLQEIGADILGLRKFVGPQSEKVTVSELLDALAADFRLRGIRSLKQSLSHLERARRHFGHYRAVEVTPALVDRWYEEQLKGENDNDRKGNRGSGREIKGNKARSSLQFARPNSVHAGQSSLGDRPATGEAERDNGEDEHVSGELGTAAPARATLNRTVSMLSQALSLAHRHGQVASRPILRQLSELGNARQGFFEADQFEAVLAHLPGHLQDFALFAYLTGWRKGEIASLTWADVDLPGRVIRLRPEHSKNAQGRMLALEGELWELTERRQAAHQFTKRSQNIVYFSGFVFHRQGKPISDFRKAWDRACREAGCPGKLFHDLRRTAVRNLIRAGVPQVVAMSISGHRTTSVFNRYNIVSETDLRDAQKKLQAFTAGR